MRTREELIDAYKKAKRIHPHGTRQEEHADELILLEVLIDIRDAIRKPITYG